MIIDPTRDKFKCHQQVAAIETRERIHIIHEGVVSSNFIVEEAHSTGSMIKSWKYNKAEIVILLTVGKVSTVAE